MTYTHYKDSLLDRIRNRQSMTGGQQFSLVALLSVPGMLAQLVHIHRCQHGG